MGYGASLHIGLNAVDPSHYDGWEGKLRACEADADSMQRICSRRGFATETLKTGSATRAGVLNRLEGLALKLSGGDTLVVSYSGHGGQMPDENGDEDDSLDETWCLFDGQILDDELHRVWAKFKPGVRIAVFSDSCHSGTVVKNMMVGRAVLPAAMLEPIFAGSRLMPPEIQARTFAANHEFYAELLAAEPPADPTCAVLLVSGCQDNQLSMDGTFNGAFTGALVRVWRDGAFQGGYEAFTKAIRAKLPSDQSPNFYAVGVWDPAFALGQVFSI